MEQSALFCSSLSWVQKGHFGKLQSEGGEREGGIKILSSSVVSRNAFLERVPNLGFVIWERFIAAEN